MNKKTSTRLVKSSNIPSILGPAFKKFAKIVINLSVVITNPYIKVTGSLSVCLSILKDLANR